MGLSRNRRQPGQEKPPGPELPPGTAPRTVPLGRVCASRRKQAEKGRRAIKRGSDRSSLSCADLDPRLPTRQPVPGTRAEQWLALIHVEIESADTVQPLRARMHDYYGQLRRHGLPVLPVALYLRVGLEGIGVDVYIERFWDFEV